MLQNSPFGEFTRLYYFMQHIKLSIDKAFGFVSEQAVANYKNQVTDANAALHNGKGKGSDFLGWLNLPTFNRRSSFGRYRKYGKNSS